MLFKIVGKHIEITEAIRLHAQDKTLKLPRYYSPLHDVEVIVDGSGGGKLSVEVIARGGRNHVFVATEQGQDLYQCLDLAVHKLERQLREIKEKERNRKHPETSGEA